MSTKFKKVTDQDVDEFYHPELAELGEPRGIEVAHEIAQRVVHRARVRLVGHEVVGAQPVEVQRGKDRDHRGRH